MLARKAAGGQPPSPFKKKVTSKIPAKRKGTLIHEIDVIGFPPTGLELYSYSKVTDGTNRSEAYTWAYRRFVDNSESIPLLDEGGFIAYYYQRKSVEDQARVIGHDTWGRYWMVRNLVGGIESTEPTRLEGLSILKRFFSSHEYSKYPPQEIVTRDITQMPPIAINRFLFDADIMRTISIIFDESLLTEDFAHQYPAIANILFPDHFPESATIQYGFGKDVSPPGHAPNFFIGDQANTGNSDDDHSAEDETNLNYSEESEKNMKTPAKRGRKKG